MYMYMNVCIYINMYIVSMYVNPCMPMYVVHAVHKYACYGNLPSADNSSITSLASFINWLISEEELMVMLMFWPLTHPCQLASLS